jgi:hypothetical protein
MATNIRAARTTPEKGGVVFAERKAYRHYGIYAGKNSMYPPGETVKRTRPLIGKTGYNFLFNNCEHFALWCKTGRHKSSQVEDICGAVFGSRVDLDELKDEITEKVISGVVNFRGGTADGLDGFDGFAANLPDY